jgi:hypothetical protein
MFTGISRHPTTTENNQDELGYTTISGIPLFLKARN